MLNRVSHSGKRPISERISVFEQRQTTTTTTSITSHGVDRTGSTETTTSQRVTRVASPVTRTFSNKNFEDLKSAFSSPTSAAAAADLSHPKQQAPPPPPIRIPGATPPPIKTVGGRTSVPLSPTQPAAPSPLEVFHPPPVAPQRSSVSLNVDSGASSPSPHKTPLKKTPSPSSSKTAARTGGNPSTPSSAQSQRGKSAKNSPQASQPQQRPGSRNSGGAPSVSGRTPSRPASKSSTSPIKPASGAMNINTMTINVKKSTVTELNGNVPGNSTTTTTTKVVRDRAVTAPLPSPTVVVTMEQPPPPKTLPHSQSAVKMEAERRRSEAPDAEKEVSVTKAEEEKSSGVCLVESKSEPVAINVPKPVVEEDDDDDGGGESDPGSPPPVQRHAPLKKTSGISQSNGGGGRSNGLLSHKDSNADFVDSLVNNKNRINAHNLVGDTSTVTTMTAAVSLTDTATSTSPPPMKKSQSSSTTTSTSGPGSNPNYWANQVSLQYENAQNTIEVQKHASKNLFLPGLPELRLDVQHRPILLLALPSIPFLPLSSHKSRKISPLTRCVRASMWIRKYLPLFCGSWQHRSLSVRSVLGSCPGMFRWLHVFARSLTLFSIQLHLRWSPNRLN